MSRIVHGTFALFMKICNYVCLSGELDWRKVVFGTYASCYLFCHRDHASFLVKAILSYIFIIAHQESFSTHVYSLLWLRPSVALIRDLWAENSDHVTHSEKNLQILMYCFSTSCDEFELTMSFKRTIVMLQTALGRPCISSSISVKGKRLKVVDTFISIGSNII